MRALDYILFGILVLGMISIPIILSNSPVHNNCEEVNKPIPLNNLGDFCDGLERLDEDIYLTWMREDGARVQLCIRGKDRELYAFSLPSDGSAEFVKVSDGKPMWYEDGSYSFAEKDD